MRYDLDYCIKIMADGQGCTLGLFGLLYRLELSKVVEDENIRSKLVEYIERMIYGD